MSSHDRPCCLVYMFRSRKQIPWGIHFTQSDYLGSKGCVCLHSVPPCRPYCLYILGAMQPWRLPLSAKLAYAYTVLYTFSGGVL